MSDVKFLDEKINSYEQRDAEIRSTDMHNLN